MMKTEITAPVGSFESLRAALQSGAGSVYFGIGQLNMRSGSAVNFSISDLPQIVKWVREAGAKAYLALNTVVFDEEIATINTIIDEAARVGIDAIIAADISVIIAARRAGLTVHISTQNNITNGEAVRFFSQWADVMVLSREMNIQQVTALAAYIKEHEIKGPSGTLVRLEAFAHGALCMAVSGKCYLSLDNLNSSANRGACTQICRRPYRVFDTEGGVELEIDQKFIMSPKDLCTIGFLDKLLAAGVSILKIEGRGRPPEYVSATVKAYHEAVDAIESGTFSQQRVDEWMKRLSAVYHRGFWEGYYMGLHTGEWAQQHGSAATHRREYIGKITNFFSKLGVAEARAETGEVFPGDVISITGPTTGLYEGTITTLHMNQGAVASVPKGGLFAFPVTSLVRRGDKLFRIVPV